MTIHPDSSELLKALPDVLDGVSVSVLDADGQPAETFGTALAGAIEVRVEVPGGALLAAVPDNDPTRVDATHSDPIETLVRALLTSVADRERLESDMESMNGSAMRLLEQVSMMGEALPRLSAGGDDTEIATLGVRACHRAAGVQRVVYLGHQPVKECCEVVVHCAGDASNLDRAVEFDQVQPLGDLLTDVLAADGVVLRNVPADGHLGEPGSIEYLAERQVLGVPVTYGAGDKRVTLGALLLIDRVETEAELGNVEGEIAESFGAMLGAVLGARKVAALGKELSMAQAIQRQILPERPVVLEGFDVAAGYFACGAVGGDYFDYVPLSDNRTMVVVADVSGHNLASGMVMVGARAVLRTLALTNDSPAKVFTALGECMYDDLTGMERFLTAAAVVLEPNGRTVDYVSAGHNDTFVYRAATDSVEAYPSEDTILGFLPKTEYSTRQMELEPGDCILLYTDGIPEAVDETGEMYGEDRLSALFCQLAPNRSAQRILGGIVQELNSFQHGEIGSDDVTVVVIRCTKEGT